MTRSLRLIGEAAADLAGAVEWYEAHRAGLGSELLRELARTLEQLSENPRLGAPVRLRGSTSVRRVRLDRFPYRVVYAAGPDEIVIVAVAHASRRPDFWRGRVQ